MREGEPATIFLTGKDIHLAMIEAGLVEVYRGQESANPQSLSTIIDEKSFPSHSASRSFALYILLRYLYSSSMNF
jgi:endonuclease YncB( thermonuclease family)